MLRLYFRIIWTRLDKRTFPTIKTSTLFMPVHNFPSRTQRTEPSTDTRIRNIVRVHFTTFTYRLAAVSCPGGHGENVHARNCDHGNGLGWVACYTIAEGKGEEILAFVRNCSVVEPLSLSFSLSLNWGVCLAAKTATVYEETPFIFFSFGAVTWVQNCFELRSCLSEKWKETNSRHIKFPEKNKSA